MKVICNRGALLDALTLTGSVVAARTPKPVLLCVKLSAEKDRLTIAATDLEVAIRYSDSQVQIERGGETLVGPYHSALGHFSGGGPTEDEKGRAADVLRQAAEFAAQARVMLGIEYLNRFECYFLTTAADALALVKRVDHPSFRMMYDTFHANIEEKAIGPTIASIAGHFIHVHISENDRGTPGSGHVHWDETFQALKKVGYDGWLVIEAFGRALPDLAAATKVWRYLFPSAEEVYTKGLALMQEKWRAFA